MSEALKAIIGDTKSCSVKIQALLGAGDQYQTIKDLNKMGSTESVSLEHV